MSPGWDSEGLTLDPHEVEACSEQRSRRQPPGSTRGLCRGVVMKKLKGDLGSKVKQHLWHADSLGSPHWLYAPVTSTPLKSHAVTPAWPFISFLPPVRPTHSSQRDLPKALFLNILFIWFSGLSCSRQDLSLWLTESIVVAHGLGSALQLVGS